MRPEAEQSSAPTLQEFSLMQQRAFVEGLTRQEWLRDWLLDVLAQPEQQHSIDSSVNGWDNIVAFFDDKNQTHQGRSFNIPDEDQLAYWQISLDRTEGTLVVRFVAQESNTTIRSSHLASLSNRIQFYQEHPVNKEIT